MRRLFCKSNHPGSICEIDRGPRGGRVPYAVMAVLGMLLMVAGVGCAQSSADPPAPARDAVIFGRVLSVPGVASHTRATARGVAGVTVTVLDAASGRLLASMISAPDGSFRFNVAPGDYAVAGAGNPHLIHVDQGQQREVNLRLPTAANR